MRALFSQKTLAQRIREIREIVRSEALLGLHEHKDMNAFKFYVGVLVSDVLEHYVVYLQDAGHLNESS